MVASVEEAALLGSEDSCGLPADTRAGRAPRPYFAISAIAALLVTVGFAALAVALQSRHAVPASTLGASLWAVRRNESPEANLSRDLTNSSRKGSFIVIGDWGWDQGHHGNLFSNACQKEIAKAMVEKFDELGDVKFIINVGDSFYPSGVTGKNDSQWDTKWRNIYDAKLRSVPWYSVYGNHDYRCDPCACSEDPLECAQVNGDESNLDYFYMPATSWFKYHPELDLEVVAMDTNQYVGSWNYKTLTAPIDCFLTKCIINCSKIIPSRAQESFRMFYDRMELSAARNMVVFSHYPTDYFAGPEPNFIAALSNNSKYHVEYFGGHRHDVDRASTASTAPNNNWLVGGGGGWGCDGQKQGFVVGEIDANSNLTTYAVLVDIQKCCPGR